MAKLNATFIEKTNKAGVYTDGLNGLYFVVGKRGGKTWRFKSRIHGVEIKRTIANYPDMKLKEARILAGEIFSAYQNDVDYFAEQAADKAQTAKDETTFQTIADEWLDIKRAKGMKESTIATDQKRLNKHALPSLATIPIKDIDKPMLREICDRTSLDAPYTANRVASMFQSIFEQAVISEVIETSPAQYLTKLYPKPKTTNNPHIQIEEIPELLTALRMGLQFELIDSVTYRMIAIQLHTLARPTEVAKLKWNYIAFDGADGACWTIPAEEMKTGVEHKQPLSPQVVAMLKEQQPYSEGSEYVFKSAVRNGKKPHRDEATANVALKNRLKYKGRLTAKGLRHTAATALAKLGYDRELIDLAQAHLVANTVSRTYNKDTRYDDRRAMLNHWSEYLTRISQ